MSLYSTTRYGVPGTRCGGMACCITVGPAVPALCTAQAANYSNPFLTMVVCHRVVRLKRPCPPRNAGACRAVPASHR